MLKHRKEARQLIEAYRKNWEPLTKEQLHSVSEFYERRAKNNMTWRYMVGFAAEYLKRGGFGMKDEEIMFRLGYYSFSYENLAKAARAAALAHEGDRCRDLYSRASRLAEEAAGVLSDHYPKLTTARDAHTFNGEIARHLGKAASFGIWDLDEYTRLIQEKHAVLRRDDVITLGQAHVRLVQALGHMNKVRTYQSQEFEHMKKTVREMTRIKRD